MLKYWGNFHHLIKEQHNKISPCLFHLQNLKFSSILPYKLTYYDSRVFAIRVSNCFAKQIHSIVFFLQLRICFTLGGEGYVHSLDPGGALTGIYLCQDSSNKKCPVLQCFQVTCTCKGY